MSFRNLDNNGDWTFGSGKQNYVKDNEEIRLDIKTRLNSWVNDCFFDLEAGIDWVNRLGSTNQKQLLEDDIKRIIAQTDGVSEILDFEVTLINRTFTANYNINTIYSTKFQDKLERAI